MKCIASGPDGNKPKERVAWTKDFFKEMENTVCHRFTAMIFIFTTGT